jgi:hypothetical protein
MAENYANDVDDVLRRIAFSAMVDRDPDKEARAEARATAQKAVEALYPGESWRGRYKQKRSNKKARSTKVPSVP